MTFYDSIVCLRSIPTPLFTTFPFSSEMAHCLLKSLIKSRRISLSSVKMSGFIEDLDTQMFGKK